MEEYDENACAAIEMNLRAPSVLPTSSGDDIKDTGGGRGSWLALGAMDVLWYYNGRGVIPQGYLDPAEELLPELLSMRRELQREAQEARTFELVTMDVLREWSAGSRIAPARLRQIWENILSDAAAAATLRNQPYPSDVGLTDEQIWWPRHGGRGLVPLRLWLEFAVEGDPEGMLACDIGFQ